jgi:release factor glutamine methyltransferase
VSLAEALAQATRDLAVNNIDSSRLEAEILLSHLLGLDRVGLYINTKQELSNEQTTAFFQLIHRRLNHEPTAYITGHKEFFGIDFHVSPGTLIPRPETELLVEKAIELANAAFPRSCLIADIGTGCGAIAIALALHLPQARIYATDVSASALEIAKGNCLRHSVSDRVTLLHGNLLEPLPEPMHIIIANLPYISDPELTVLPTEIAMFEPQVALAGGKDGLRQIEKLLSQASSKLSSEGAVLLEIGYDQGLAVSLLAKKYIPGATVNVLTDLAGLDRVVTLLTPR